jgi:hypothetical protein
MAEFARVSIFEYNYQREARGERGTFPEQPPYRKIAVRSEIWWSLATR